MSSLSEIEELYQQVMRSPAGDARDRALSRLMTNMEIEYHISALRNPEWESKNKAVIAMYRKLSMSRTTV
jgi:hypothetical protein